MPSTLYDKLWESHKIHDLDKDEALIYIDKHLINEVTSPQAFAGMRAKSRKVWSESSIVATADHNTPTTDPEAGVSDDLARAQIDALDDNLKSLTGAEYYPYPSNEQGIVHVIGPELGITQPGLTIVCGDSHTSTHGAFSALAFGIGTSDVEHVLATQTLALKKSKNYRISVSGCLPAGVYAKDLALHVIKRIGTAGATGHVIEFTGEAVRALSMEARMTLCNMAIEAGARTGLVGVDETTLEYLKDRPKSPSQGLWPEAVHYWTSLNTDEGALFHKSLALDAGEVVPLVTWGTSPEMVVSVTDVVPNPGLIDDPIRRAGFERALTYMGLEPGQRMQDLRLDKVFIGSCTNSRIEDLRIVADLVKGCRIAEHLKQALIVPGSGAVKRQAEKEGLDKIFIEAGFEWRRPGCSMCLGMNEDRLLPGERCASTSNRNFEGRQGQGGRSHLMSPAMAAVSALNGLITDVREYL
ncbi:3-isopropylmalate dehydratase large subunit [Marinobacter sp. 71-i]|uniref:3-isopropylmalate dehydratase large subunit n=1 Tax=Marinobacter iranensis TaxID=2962607 RepID=A0ABT5YFZ4_9GAMM|nr:3-isopropylmalate dehydratase large subunit [Marinobacter iranensis]MDF0752580.1 3-isopropylmalate dehydratase large subunit [Marinobacter iranensis]